jgi:hypothetical protein
MNSDCLRFIPSISIYPYFSVFHTQVRIILLQREVPTDAFERASASIVLTDIADTAVLTEPASSSCGTETSTGGNSGTLLILSAVASDLGWRVKATLAVVGLVTSLAGEAGSASLFARTTGSAEDAAALAAGTAPPPAAAAADIVPCLVGEGIVKATKTDTLKATRRC